MIHHLLSMKADENVILRSLRLLIGFYHGCLWEIEFLSDFEKKADKDPVNPACQAEALRRLVRYIF